MTELQPYSSVALANWFINRAKGDNRTAAELCKAAGSHPSYLSKVKAEDIAKMPADRIKAFADALRVPPSLPFVELGVPLPSWLQESVGARFEGAPEIIEFPYCVDVPDHGWPALLQTVLLENFNIRLHPKPMLIGDFKDHLEKIERGAGDTLVVVPQHWRRAAGLSALTPVAVSHYYRGYALVGLRGHKLPELPALPAMLPQSYTPAGLFWLMAMLSYHGVFKRKTSIVYADQGGVEFLKAMIAVARADPATKEILDHALPREPLFVAARAISRTFLDDLDPLEEGSANFTVGQGLTLAVALTEGGRYKIYACYRDLNVIVKDLSVTEDERRRLQQMVHALKRPVELAMNIDDRSPRARKILAARVAAATYTAKSYIRTLGDSAFQGLAQSLGKECEMQISAAALKEAWDMSYEFLDLRDAIRELKRDPEYKAVYELARAIERSRVAVAADFERLAAAGEPESKVLENAKFHFKNGNFPEASKVLGLPIPEIGFSR